MTNFVGLIAFVWDRQLEKEGVVLNYNDKTERYCFGWHIPEGEEGPLGNWDEWLTDEQMEDEGILFSRSTYIFK